MKIKIDVEGLTNEGKSTIAREIELHLNSCGFKNVSIVDPDISHPNYNDVLLHGRRVLSLIDKNVVIEIETIQGFREAHLP